MAPFETDTIDLGTVRDGYPALATWIARDPDNESFVFRKFNRLGARNLLHLQSQLIALEHEIDQLDEKARNSQDDETRNSSRRWETFMKHITDDSRQEKARFDKANELRTLIKDYHEALVLQSNIIMMKHPSSRVLNVFRDYLDGGNLKGERGQILSLPLLSGRAKNMLSDEADLIALQNQGDEDVLSKLLQDHWAFQKRKTDDWLDRTTLYKGQHVVTTVTVISMTIAAILLVGAITHLYYVKSANVKLGLLAAYTTLFALSVALATNAKRAEVFAATAAYAAVLVVFVSGNLSGPIGEQCLIQIEGGYFRMVQCPD